MSVERLTTSEVARKLLERPQPATGRPKFAVRQVKGVGGATVIEWEVEVPVCDEYPTAEEAFRAARNFAEDFEQKYKIKDDLEAKLHETVRVVRGLDEQEAEKKAAEKNAREAAAMARSQAIARSQAKR